MKAISAICLSLFLFMIEAVPAGAADVAVDSAGNSYFFNYSGPPNYRYSLFKVSPSGELIFARPMDPLSSYPTDIALDPAGFIYVSGTANRSDPAETVGSEANEAFVAKLTPDGTGIIYESFVGTPTNGVDLAVDAQGRAYVLYEYTYHDGPYYYVALVARFSPSGSIEMWSTGRAHFVTAMAVGPSEDLFTVGWVSDDYGNPYQRVILERMDASSGVPVTETLIDVAGTVDWFVKVAATPGDGSVVAWVKNGWLHVSEFGPAEEKIFSRVLNAGAVSVQDLAVTSSGEIAVTYSTRSGNHVLRLEGGTGKILFSSVNLPPDCSGATASPSVLGPANAKMVQVSIRDVADAPGDRLTIALSSIFQDEGLTSPSTPDATGLGTATALLRAARLSYGNGRVYHLRFTATDSQGKACAGTVKVCVPVLQGGTCVDGGARVNSTRSY